MSGWALLGRTKGKLAPVVLPARAIIGSDRDCEVRLVGKGIGSRHARVRVDGERLRFEAVGTARVILGTGEQERVWARDGDVVWLASEPWLVTRHEVRNRRSWLAIGGLGSSSTAAWSAWMELALAAPHPWPLLLLGESGTGKEVAARLCHERSRRRDGPFVAINCAALPSNLAEAELFGSAKGAFTGAIEARAGAFVRADGGTLLLDEIGELPLAVQAALLRVLESGDVQVVGGGVRKVDVRIIAATHVDLERACQQGKFRLDLLHRVAVTGTTLPPLRERNRDPALLLEEMLGCELPAGVAKNVNAYAWPGNARQVRNVARRTRLVCPHGAVGRRQLLGVIAKLPGQTSRRGSDVAAREQSPDARLAMVREALQREATVGRAWRSTGLPRSTFYRYLHRARAGQSRDSQPRYPPRKTRVSAVFDGVGATATVNA